MVLSAADQKVVDDVATHGWSCMNVGAGDGEPNFSYSIGWWEKIKSPEAIVFGLPSKLQHSILWELFRQVKGGLELSDGLRIANLVEGHDCIARPVHSSQMREYFGFALWYRRLRSGPFASLQAFAIFWPGKNQGLFPWDADCEHAVRDAQPLIYLRRQSGSA